MKHLRAGTLAAVGSALGLRRRLARTSGGVVSLSGWSAALAWIESWMRFGNWIVVDRESHSDLCRMLSPHSWHVLWYEPVDTSGVWALLAELRGRNETKGILVVRQVADGATLESTESDALQRVCRQYHATLLVVTPLQ
jgi:hypothetical protein